MCWVTAISRRETVSIRGALHRELVTGCCFKAECLIVERISFVISISLPKVNGMNDCVVNDVFDFPTVLFLVVEISEEVFNAEYRLMTEVAF